MADAPKGSITGGQSWPLLRRIIVLYGLVSAAVQDRELMFDELLEQALDDDEIKAPAESAGVPAAELTEKAREGRQTIEGSSISESSLVSTAELAVRRTRVRVQLFVGLFGLVALAAGVLLTYDQVRGWLLVGASIAFLVAGLVVGLVTAAALAPVGWLTVRDELESAYGLYRSALLERGILPFLREEINRATTPDYSLELHYESARGLSQLTDESFEVPTAATEHLRDLIREMPGGSVGIAGPRGAGKSTLIRAFCSGRFRPPRALTVSVAAPVDYATRDFILHLYGMLCRAIAGDSTPRYGPRERLLRTMLVLAGVSLLVTCGVLLIVFDDSLPSLTTGQSLGAGLVAAAVFVFFIVILPKVVFGEFTPLPADDDLLGVGIVGEARSRLERIRFLQSLSSGWSGQLKLPIGAVGLTGGRTLTEQQATLPDLVDEFRAFATTVAQRAPGGLVIGVDELDKIAGAEDAQKFMNDIKGVFGIPNCFFLISISEDALANFDRRGVPIRDAFDSSLDDVVRVGYLPLAGTRRLLQRRVVGLGEGFICLCHAVAAGLPRDVIRLARAIVQSRPVEGPGTLLAQVTETVLRTDFEAKRRATTVAATAFSPLAEVGPVVAWLHRLELPEELSGSAAILPPPIPSLADRPASEVEKLRLLAHLAEEFAAFAYVSLTIRELFSSFDSATLQGAATGPAPSVFDTLAAARQSLAVHPRLAWEETSSVRAASSLSIAPPWADSPLQAPTPTPVGA